MIMSCVQDITCNDQLNSLSNYYSRMLMTSVRTTYNYLRTKLTTASISTRHCKTAFEFFLFLLLFTQITISTLTVTVNMSSIVTSVIKFTFGFLLTKVRDHTANRLDEGDPADEIFRKLIVRETTAIKASIVALARTDLNCSISSLREGINLLNISIEKSAANAETRFDQVKEPTDVFDGALALSQATEELKITHENRFALAKESLKKARDMSTRAFGDEALSTEERIFAAKLRVISRILVSLEDPEAAVATCKGYLEELHDLRAVRKTFTRYLDRGITAIFGKEKGANM